MKKRDKITVGDEVGDGLRPFKRENADGSTQDGFIGDHRHWDRADAYVQMKPVEGGCRHEFEVVDEYSFSSRGSTGAASEAYRSGWDQTFRSKGSHAAN
jgi:hypothetical protein